MSCAQLYPIYKADKYIMKQSRINRQHNTKTIYMIKYKIMKRL